MKIGILGGGQLGRMLAIAGYPLGFEFRFLDPSADAPVGSLAELIVGDYTDSAALERFARGLDVITYEFENVPVSAALSLAEFAPVYPPPASLEVSQDRLMEKSFFRELGIATPEFTAVDSLEALYEGIRQVGVPAVLKTRRLGYDGKGQEVIREDTSLEGVWSRLGGAPLILERFVAFRRELSILAARGRNGPSVFYPLVENHHREGILRLSLAPAAAADSIQREAEAIAGRAMEKLDYVGVLAIELFETEGGLVVNEMAPRVHNSGHWTIEGAETSQFENHLRSIAGLPPGVTQARGRSAMINLIGALPPVRDIMGIPGAHLHLYGKDPRPGRKLGHVTLNGSLERVAEGLNTMRRIIPDLPEAATS